MKAYPVEIGDPVNDSKRGELLPNQEEHKGQIRQLPYDVFLAERRQFVEARQRLQQRANNLIVTGAAGALVLSITFLDRIATTPSPGSHSVLAFAWGALLTALGLNLISTFTAARAFDRAIDEFDRSHIGGTAENALSTSWLDGTRLLVAGSAVSFICGVGLLARFAFLNLP
jgi:hypothetical protein